MKRGSFGRLAGLATAAVAAAILCQSAAAAEPPVAVAGGALDPAFPGADVYLGAPRSAAVPAGPACQAARRYVELVNKGDAVAVSALYADDAIILEPMRRTIRGRPQIDEFYATRLAQMRPQLVGVSYLGNARECMVELANRTQIGEEQRYVLVSIDHFILKPDGKVATMVAFARPPRR